MLLIPSSKIQLFHCAVTFRPAPDRWSNDSPQTDWLTSCAGIFPFQWFRGRLLWEIAERELSAVCSNPQFTTRYASWISIVQILCICHCYYPPSESRNSPKYYLVKYPYLEVIFQLMIWVRDGLRLDNNALYSLQAFSPSYSALSELWSVTGTKCSNVDSLVVINPLYGLLSCSRLVTYL